MTTLLRRGSVWLSAVVIAALAFPAGAAEPEPEGVDAAAPAPVENAAKADNSNKAEKPAKGEKEKKEEKDLPIVASLEVRGSGAMGQLARAMAELYMADHPDTIVTVQTCGANQGIKALIIGTCDLAMGTDEVPEELAKLATDREVKLKRTDIYRDALAVVVNADNPVTGLTLKQVRDIFRGVTTNWSAVGGSDAPIEVLTLNSTSAAYEVFKRKVLGEEAVITPKATLVTGKQLKESLKENSIVYVGMTQMIKNGFKGLAIDGVLPSVESIKNGKYPIGREMSLYQREPAPPLGDRFIEYFQASDKGEKQIIAAGNVPVVKR